MSKTRMTNAQLKVALELEQAKTEYHELLKVQLENAANELICLNEDIDHLQHSNQIARKEIHRLENEINKANNFAEKITEQNRILLNKVNTAWQVMDKLSDTEE